MEKIKKSKGITLVALVVTIVVLLILAGITISYVMGDNSVFKQAQNAKVQTELGKIEERANLIYTDKLMKNTSANLKNKPTMQEIVDQLKTEGYEVKQVAISGDIITGIALDKESMTLGFEGIGEIKVTIEIGSGMNYYAVVSGKYYQMNHNNGYITLDRTPSEISDEGEVTTPTLMVASENESIVIANIDNATNIITVNAKAEGTTTITVSSTDGNSQPAICTITVTPPRLADIVDKIQDTNREIEDENGNKITIPGGFKVVPDTEDNDVDYTYSEDKKPCVQDGVVIEDEEGNQFVWVPVGKIKNKDNTITTITLGRYTFDSTNGTPKLEQNADNYTETVTIQTYYQELEKSSYNTPTKNLGDFVTKTKINGGYYLGRYEASRDSVGKVKSQADLATWINITQTEAASYAREMYKNNNYVESDLSNSYSWDTAIVFIQNYSGDSNYANKTTVNFNLLNTGKAGDKVCNIHDMASNCAEWSTEHSVYKPIKVSYPCVARGGNYRDPNDTMSIRITFAVWNDYAAGDNASFRPLCYLK